MSVVATLMVDAVYALALRLDVAQSAAFGGRSGVPPALPSAQWEVKMYKVVEREEWSIERAEYLHAKGYEIFSIMKPKPYHGAPYWLCWERTLEEPGEIWAFALDRLESAYRCIDRKPRNPRLGYADDDFESMLLASTWDAQELLTDAMLRAGRVVRERMQSVDNRQAWSDGFEAGWEAAEESMRDSR